VRVKLPDPLLQKAATRAHELGRHIDELWAEAITRYVSVNTDKPAGAMRSRGGIPSGSPSLIIEIPEDLFQRADKLAKRLGKQRDVLYCEALATHVSYSAATASAFDGGHSLPNKAAARGKPGG
jgi:predicted transcriptional regulator